MQRRRAALSYSPRAALAALLGLLGAGCMAQAPAISNSESTTAPLVIGHRGASGYRPEHTLASYALAIEQGADFIEPDLVISADGALIARHENEIGGTTDVAAHAEFAARRTTRTIDGREITGWFTEDFSLEELKTLRARERIPQLRAANTQFDGQFGIPTFDEVIALVRNHNEDSAARARRNGRPTPRPVGIYPETKHPSYFRSIGKPLEAPLVAALRRARLNRAEAPVFIQSFETGNLRRLKGMTKVRLMQLIEGEGAPHDLMATGRPSTYADMITAEGLADIATYAYGIGVAKELVIARTTEGAMGIPTSLVRNAHERGLMVHAWTFRRENAFLPANLRSAAAAGDAGSLGEEIAAYLEAGVDGVFSDNPDLAVRARDRFLDSRPRSGL